MGLKYSFFAGFIFSFFSLSYANCFSVNRPGNLIEITSIGAFVSQNRHGMIREQFISFPQRTGPLTIVINDNFIELISTQHMKMENSLTRINTIIKENKISYSKLNQTTKLTYSDVVKLIAYWGFDDMDYFFSNGETVVFPKTSERGSYLASEMRKKNDWLNSLLKVEEKIIQTTDFYPGKIYENIPDKYKNNDYEAAKFIIPAPKGMLYEMFVVRATALMVKK